VKKKKKVFYGVFVSAPGHWMENSRVNIQSKISHGFGLTWRWKNDDGIAFFFGEL